MLNIVPTTNVPCHNYHLPYKTKTGVTMWKLETTAKGNFGYFSLFKQQGNSEFEFISVSFSAITVGYIRYQLTVSLKLYDLNIESFLFSLDSSFYIEKPFNKEKIHSGLFLSLAITSIAVNDIIRYTSSSLKYHLTSIFTVF